MNQNSLPLPRSVGRVRSINVEPITVIQMSPHTNPHIRLYEDFLKLYEQPLILIIVFCHLIQNV